MAILSSSTWMLLLFDVVGTWLLVRPSDPVNLWSAHRATASDFDRFVARLVGVIMLSAQVTHWVGQSKKSNAGPIMHWLSIIFWVGALVFVGYQVVGLFTSTSDRGRQVDESRRRFLLPESEEESRIRYRAAWQEYRRVRVLFPVAFLGWLPFGVAVFLVFGLFHWNPYIATIVVLAWIPFISIFGWQWSFWQCPRCGYAFKGPYDPFFPKRCHYCNLPMWAESPDR